MYDYVFYLSRNTKFNLPHLREKLIESNVLNKEQAVDVEDIRNLLNKRFDEIDFENAKEDVIPFIKKTDVLDIWSKEFFKEISLNLESK